MNVAQCDRQKREEGADEFTLSLLSLQCPRICSLPAASVDHWRVSHPTDLPKRCGRSFAAFQRPVTTKRVSSVVQHGRREERQIWSCTLQRMIPMRWRSNTTWYTLRSA